MKNDISNPFFSRQPTANSVLWIIVTHYCKSTALCSMPSTCAIPEASWPSNRICSRRVPLRRGLPIHYI